VSRQFGTHAAKFELRFSPKTFTVEVTIVRELYGVMAANGAAGGFVVTIAG